MKTKAFLILSAVCMAVLLIGVACSKDDDNGNNGDGNGTDTTSDSSQIGDSDSTDSDSDVNKPDSDTTTEVDTTPLPESCDESNYQINIQKIDMLVLLDRSQSMEIDKIWEPMGSALTAVTEDYKNMVNFGLMLFPGGGDKCDQEDKETVCVASDPTSPDVPIGAPSAATAIAAVFDDQSGSHVTPCGGTPIAESLIAAKDYLQGLEEQKKRYVLLATDGAPNCNAALNGDTCTCTSAETDACKKENLNCLDDANTYDAAEELYADAGVDTYVIGMGETVNDKWETQLTNIAKAGGTETYLPVTDNNKLQEAFETVTQNVVNCNFAIDWASLSEDASTDKDKINFFCKEKAGDDLSMQNLVRYDENCGKNTGWDWVSDDLVLFCKGACDRLKKRQCTSVAVTFGCEGGTIVVK